MAVVAFQKAKQRSEADDLEAAAEAMVAELGMRAGW